MTSKQSPSDHALTTPITERHTSGVLNAGPAPSVVLMIKLETCTSTNPTGNESRAASSMAC